MRLRSAALGRFPGTVHMCRHSKTQPTDVGFLSTQFVEDQVRKILTDIITEEACWYFECCNTVLRVSEFDGFDPVLIVVLANGFTQVLS